MGKPGSEAAREWRDANDNFKGVHVDPISMNRLNKPAYQVVVAQRVRSEFPTEQEANAEAEVYRMTTYAHKEKLRVLREAAKRNCHLCVCPTLALEGMFHRKPNGNIFECKSFTIHQIIAEIEAEEQPCKAEERTTT